MSLASELSDGMGGLKFVAKAPPGLGRLCRVPFYLQSAVAGFDAQVPGAAAAPAASGTASAVSPVILASAPAAAGTANTAILRTPQISWATLRIVGFECAISQTANIQQGAQPELMFADLKIGGGANLFVHEDYAPSRIYSAGQDAFAGLRDYPLLKSPNVAEVAVQVFSPVAAAALPPATDGLGWDLQQLFSCNLVCEILQDDNYGSHVPGPYARSGAMVRRGGSFSS